MLACWQITDKVQGNLTNNRIFLCDSTVKDRPGKSINRGYLTGSFCCLPQVSSILSATCSSSSWGGGPHQQWCTSSWTAAGTWGLPSLSRKMWQPQESLAWQPYSFLAESSETVREYFFDNSEEVRQSEVSRLVRRHSSMQFCPAVDIRASTTCLWNQSSGKYCTPCLVF